MAVLLSQHALSNLKYHAGSDPAGENKRADDRPHQGVRKILYVCRYACVYLYRYGYKDVCVHLYMVCTCIYVSMHMEIYVCMFL